MTPQQSHSRLSGRRRRLVLLNYGPLILSPIAVSYFSTIYDVPRWGYMWLLALGLFAGCKWLSWRRRRSQHSPPWLHLAYLFTWPGMNAGAFLRFDPQNEHGKAIQVDPMEWAGAVLRSIAGLFFLFVIPALFSAAPSYWIGWSGMLGIVLLLHFGLFHLISCWWRTINIVAEPLMQKPTASQTLTEFWGLRWNTAFRDLTHHHLFMPLSRYLGPRLALGAGFLISGLIHEIAISLPAGAGYGLPTLYFLLQASGIYFQRSSVGRILRKRNKWFEKLITAAVIILPAPLLFHPPFIHQIILPFMKAIGAL